jgi:hypothetical protein
MFFTPEPIVKVFGDMAAQHPVPAEEGPSTEAGWNALDFLQALDLATLSRQAGLSGEEYVILLTSTDVQRVSSLALTGITRLRAAETPGRQSAH